jgi:hypothetical protein
MTQSPSQPVAPSQPPQGNGVAVAGMVLGIVTLVLSWLWFISIPAGIVGLILSIIGKAKAKKVGKGNGMALTGLILSTIGIIIAVIVVIVGIIAIGHFQKISDSMSQP